MLPNAQNRPDRANRHGFRGYMGTRMAFGRSTPQHIQQLVMRDYCSKRGMHYLLAAVEYRMEGCTMVLSALLKDLASIEGIIMYSFSQLPTSKAKRLELYRALFEAGCTLHLAVENITIADDADAARMEDIWLTQDIIALQPDTIHQLQQWNMQHAGN